MTDDMLGYTRLFPFGRVPEAEFAETTDDWSIGADVVAFYEGLGYAVEERISQLLNAHINPAIASHGGYVNLLSVDGSTAHVEMGGGCQGCGMAAMTLRNGIEAAIKHNIPEITEVADATDHMAGTNPYY